MDKSIATIETPVEASTETAATVSRWQKVKAAGRKVRTTLINRNVAGYAAVLTVGVIVGSAVCMGIDQMQD